MLIHEIAISNLHVVLPWSGRTVGEDGETHHGVFDVGYLSSIQNMKIYCPAFICRTRICSNMQLQRKGPVGGPISLGMRRAIQKGGTSHVKTCPAGSDVSIATMAFPSMRPEAAEKMKLRGFPLG
jgi:1-deoxy-D-xylulose-5-phosphate synthase